MDLIQEANISTIKAKYIKSFPKTFILSFNEFYKNKAIFCTSWDQFLIFNGKYYELHNKKQMQHIFSDFFDDNFIEKIGSFSMSFLNNVYDLAKVMFPLQIEDTELDHDFFSFNDGLYNTLTHEQQPHTPDIFVFKHINANIANFKDPSPYFDEYFTSTFVSHDNVNEFDPDLLNVYQEMCGSLFSGQRKVNRAFFLWGKGANGKSVTTEFLFNLFQESYTAAASLETLSSRFGKSRLVGKVINICSEEESQYFKHDIFKALVTGEKIDAERKNEPGFSYHSCAKLIFATNNFPRFSGLDFSTRRRVIVIPFNRTFFPDKCDHDLLEKLKTEKSQFISFALEGLKRLQANNYQYSVSKQITESLDELEAESSSSIRFWKDFVIPSEAIGDGIFAISALTAMEIYPLYRDWCIDNGFKAQKSTTFSRQIAGLESAKRVSNNKTGGTWKYYIEFPRPYSESLNLNKPVWPIQ